MFFCKFTRQFHECDNATSNHLSVFCYTCLEKLPDIEKMQYARNLCTIYRAAFGKTPTTISSAVEVAYHIRNFEVAYFSIR